MPRSTTYTTAWDQPGDEEDDRAFGPEDYAWFAQTHPDMGSDWVPDLQWIWDRSERELVDHLISVAALQPAGSA